MVRLVEGRLYSGFDGSDILRKGLYVSGHNVPDPL